MIAMRNLRYPLLLLPTQKIVRALLLNPSTSAWMWTRIPKLRSYFAKHYGKGRFITHFDGDLKIWASLSDHIESHIFWQEVQEGDRGEVKLLKSLLRPNDVFIDVGANIGVFTLIMAKRLSSGTVHAFEPSPYHTEKLKSNLLLNQINNIHTHAFALSNVHHSSKLYFPPSVDGFLNNTGMASLFQFDQASSRTEKIECVRLDDYAKSHGITCFSIMKIDVEGAEMDVLLGAIESIRRNRPHVVMEINLNHLQRAGRKVQEVIDFWFPLGYEIFRINHDAALSEINTVADFETHQNIYCRPVGQLEAAER